MVRFTHSIQMSFNDCSFLPESPWQVKDKVAKRGCGEWLFGVRRPKVGFCYRIFFRSKVVEVLWFFFQRITVKWCEKLMRKNWMPVAWSFADWSGIVILLSSQYSGQKSFHAHWIGFPSITKRSDWGRWKSWRHKKGCLDFDENNKVVGNWGYVHVRGYIGQIWSSMFCETYTLPETNSAHLDGWKTIVSFWGPAYFQGRAVT